MSDREAFVRAIAADPSNDVARLAFADWLDEHDDPARAEFVRAQVEAAGLHRNAARKRLLDARAAELFAANWVAWWGEVAAAVGLPAPHVPAPRGWLRRQFSAERPGGWPYVREGFQIRVELEVRNPITFTPAVSFRRGFPDEVSVFRLWGSDEISQSWRSLSPLVRLTLLLPPEQISVISADTFDTVSELQLSTAPRSAFDSLCRLPNFARVRSLILRTWSAGECVAGVEVLNDTPMAPRLRRLILDAGQATPGTIDAVRDATNLANLEELRVANEAGADAGVFEWEVAPRVADLARAPHLTNLTALDLPVSHASAVRAIVGRPAWFGLRRLALRHPLGVEAAAALADSDGVPLLEDLTIELAGGIDHLAAGPMLKRLRHLELTCVGSAPFPDAALTRLFAALDDARVETLCVRNAPLPDREKARLRERFGDRVWFA